MKIKLLISSAALVGVVMQAFAQPKLPTCNVIFSNGDIVEAKVEKADPTTETARPILVAESSGWKTDKEGARIEIEYLLSAMDSKPMITYLRKMAPVAMTGGGSTIQVPDVKVYHRRYWLKRIEELDILGVEGEKFASIKCVTN
jgi:hypothetical protein